MTTRRAPGRPAPSAAQSIFERILVGVDGTSESLEACRQVVRLAEPTTTIEAAIVLFFRPETASPLVAQDLAERLEGTAGPALAEAAEILGPQAELRSLHGLTVEALLDEVERRDATLLAIGTHEHPRLEEIVLGGVAGELLHQAPCSVLVARPAPEPATFPREIVVGIDGSHEAERAFEVARSVAGRRHSTVRGLVAQGGRGVELGEIAKRHPGVDGVAGGPVAALVAASSSADLLVVGSRGLHGPRALGSVSERVAHEATCSVLVVR